MRQRWLELMLVICVVAMATILIKRPRVESPPPATPFPRLTPGWSASPGSPFEGQEDYWKAEGQRGFQNVLRLKIPESTPVSVERGRKLAEASCTPCHGPLLAGNGHFGKTLDPPPGDLTRPEAYKYGHRERAVYRSTFYGIEGTGMAPYENPFTIQQTWDLVHYVRSLQKPEHL